MSAVKCGPCERGSGHASTAQCSELLCSTCFSCCTLARKPTRCKASVPCGFQVYLTHGQPLSSLICYRYCVGCGSSSATPLHCYARVIVLTMQVCVTRRAVLTSKQGYNRVITGCQSRLQTAVPVCDAVGYMQM